MTTGLLLLVVVVVVSSARSVDSQSTTDDQVCDGGVLSELKRYVQILHDNQLLQFQTFMSRLTSIDSQLVQFQNFMSRLMSNDNQSTTGDGVSAGAVLAELKRDVQILQHSVMSRLGKLSQNKIY